MLCIINVITMNFNVQIMSLLVVRNLLVHGYNMIQNTCIRFVRENLWNLKQKYLELI